MKSEENMKYDSPVINWLQKHGVDFEDGNFEDIKSHRFKTPGLMDLVVEIWKKENGKLHVSVSHIGEQNGDLMHDPEIVYEVDNTSKKVIPLSYKNDYTGMTQQTYTKKNGELTVNQNDLQEMTVFTKIWAENISAAGYKMTVKSENSDEEDDI